MTGVYMVSAQKPTAVNQSILGHVTSENELNLLIAKNTILEIYKVAAEGLKFARQISIWGIIESLKLIRPKNEKKDLIVIITAKHDIMVLSCETNDDGTYEIVTRAHGNLKEQVSRSSQTRVICAVDPFSTLIAVKSYDGIIKIIPIGNECKQLNVQTLRMEDLNVLDAAFLNGYNSSTPTLGVICKEPTSKLSFKAYETDHRSKEVVQVLWKKDIHDTQAFIIPVPEPCLGVLVIGTETIYYLNTNEQIQIAPSVLKNQILTTFCRIDPTGQRYLLSSLSGNLYMLLLDYDSSMMTNCKVNHLQLELLGETSVADNISYIDNGVVFIGSKLGDSQLIKLNEQANENKSYIDVLETYTNLGPIMDMLIVDIEKQGQGQLITCSGAHRNGSLRIIRNGIGIHENANVEIPGLKAFWPLKISSDVDNYLILSFYDYTKIFSFFGEEFEDVELDGIDTSAQTLQCSNVRFNQILQITSLSVRLSSDSSCQLIDEWKLSENELISVASNNFYQCLCASRDKIYYLLINENKLEFIKSVRLDHEIACLDISPFKENEMANIVAVGLWKDISARVLQLPHLTELCSEQLGGEVIPRSIVIEVLETLPYLFVSLGDGSVISYIIAKRSEDEYELTERRKVVLGTQPTILKKFKSFKNEITNNIFACSDRPSVISTNNQKLAYSSVNLKQVEYMCPINSNSYPNSLALLSDGVLRIGTMDNIQKLHIRTVKLNEQVRRIAYQNDTQTFGILTQRNDVINHNGEVEIIKPSASTLCPSQHNCTTKFSSSDSSTSTNNTNPNTSSKISANATNMDVSNANGGKLSSTKYDEINVSSFLILDQNTFEVLHSVKFQMYEFASSIVSLTFEGETSPYFVCGCCQVIDEEPEPKVGRLVVFKYNENKLIQVCEKEIKGAPYTMTAYNGKLLTSVNNSIKLFQFEDDQLNLVASFSDNVFITHLTCKNDFILAGDVMKSCSVLVYRSDNKSFELVSKDHSPIWLNSMEMIDDENFIISDSSYNLSLLKKDSGQSNEDERKSLQNYGCIHIGEQINVFKHGSFGMPQSNELFATHFQGMIIAGTVSGAIIVFSQLSNSMFKILNELQTRLAKKIVTAGKINYDKWRLYENDRRTDGHKYFIDGDLIESYLDLSSSEAASILKDFKVDIAGNNALEDFSPSYFTKLVEELNRIH